MAYDRVKPTYTKFANGTANSKNVQPHRWVLAQRARECQAAFRWVTRIPQTYSLLLHRGRTFVVWLCNTEQCSLSARTDWNMCVPSLSATFLLPREWVRPHQAATFYVEYIYGFVRWGGLQAKSMTSQRAAFKMAVMRYYGNVVTRTRWLLYSTSSTTVIDWTCYIVFFCCRNTKVASARALV